MKILIVSALLLAVMFAGCADEKVGDTASSTSTSSSPNSTSSSTSSSTGSTSSSSSTTSSSASSSSSSSSAAANQAPVIDSFAVVSAGGLQANATFALSDADGEPVSWTLDFNGDGTKDYDGTGDATVGHTFAAAGTFQVNLVATDGKATVNKTLEITVTAPVAGPFQVISGSWVLSTPVDCLYGGVESGATTLEASLLPGAGGRTYTATYTWATPVPGIYSGIAFYAGNSYLTDHFAAPAGSTVSGAIPNTATAIQAYACSTPSVSFKMTIA